MTGSMDWLMGDEWSVVGGKVMDSKWQVIGSWW